MITAERKPLSEIMEMIAPYQNVLVLGCGTCVTVCFAGGDKEAKVLAAELRMARAMAGMPVQVTDYTIQRQCEWEYIDSIAEMVSSVDAILSLACGIGIQAVGERFAQAVVLPGVNTTFLGMPTEPGLFAERCQACGDCVLAETAGICPIARCAKSLLNGPCGGSQRGKCEVNEEIDCAWQLICDRLMERGQLEKLMEVRPAKNWRPSRDGGQRKIVREDLRL
jgi:ferredoxin